MTGYTFLKPAHTSSTFALSSLSAATIEPGCLAAHSDIFCPLRITSLNASSSDNTPANASAGISPNEKPAATSALMPAASNALAHARSVKKRHGCVFSVCVSASPGPSKHIASLPGLIASPISNTAFAAALLSYKSLPMPTDWAPCPANKNAILPIFHPPFSV